MYMFNDYVYECDARVCVCIYRNGCATSEDMLWKLEALQTFVFDLHWPDEVFAEHINQRLKTLSTEMIEAAANRYTVEKYRISTDILWRAFYILTGPVPCTFVWVNRRNSEACSGYTDIFAVYRSVHTSHLISFHHI